MRAFAYCFAMKNACFRKLAACLMASRVACCDMREEIAGAWDERGWACSGQGAAAAVCRGGDEPLLIPTVPLLTGRPLQALQRLLMAHKNRISGTGLPRCQTPEGWCGQQCVYALVQNVLWCCSILTSSCSYTLAWPQGCRRWHLSFCGPVNIEICRWSGGRGRRSLVH